MSLFLMCIKIFFARLIDVSLGTFRTINTVKGRDLIAALIGLIEITVWFLVVKEALNTNNNSYFIVAAYALGFSVGTYIGGKISKLFIKSNLEVQVILSSKDDNVVNRIRENGYGVTAIEVKGTKDTKYMLYIQIRDNTLENLKKILRKLDNKAFIVVNETKYVENGYFGVEK
ncbi:MAG: DUF2179 domain-containing protein [Firmicutes bacterium]|nr:DUF2179 domain-containing protein [Bacillota bacterium]